MTTNYKDFNINYFNVSGELKQAAKGSTAFLTYGANNGTSNTPLFLQLPWILLDNYGIPRLNEFFTEDSQRCFVKTPLNDADPEVASCKTQLKSIDNKFSSDEFKIKLFGAAKAKKFAYQEIVRSPLIDDENKNKNTMDYMKIKLSTNYDTGEINTSVCTSIMENNKRVRANVADETIKTVDDISKYICYGARVRFIIRPVKLWAQASNASKDPMYGITFKLVKAEVELPMRMNTYKNLLNTDMFLDSDEESENIQTVASVSQPQVTVMAGSTSSTLPVASKVKPIVAVVASESSDEESESDEEQIASVKTINRTKSGAPDLTDEESDEEDIKPVVKNPTKAPAKSKSKKASA
jgi:hypothetical protein